MPFDPDYISGLSPRVSVSGASFNDESVTTIVFADPSSPLTNPAMGIELLPGGGFRPWGVNLDGTTLEALSEFLVRRDGDWMIADESGLVEVARFSASSSDMLRNGWQLDFGSEPSDVIWQAEPDNGAGIWIWIARLADTGSGETPRSLRPIQVLGHQGVVVEPTGTWEQDYVLWTDDDFIYRLSAGEAFGRSGSAIVPELRVADAGEWDARMAAANNFLGIDNLVLVDLFVLALTLATGLYCLVRGPRLGALYAVLAAMLWWALGAAPGLTIALIVGLGATWWWILRRRKPSPPPSEEPV